MSANEIRGNTGDVENENPKPCISFLIPLSTILVLLPISFVYAIIKNLLSNFVFLDLRVF